MPFDIEAEENEPLKTLELFFDSGKPRSKDDLPMPPRAYIGMGSYGSHEGHPMLTSTATSVGELKFEIEALKARLDTLLAEAKARFAVANSN